MPFDVKASMDKICWRESKYQKSPSDKVIMHITLKYGALLLHVTGSRIGRSNGVFSLIYKGVSSSDSKILDFEILEFSSIFSQILASTRVLELK
jgi:hypothetical protein